MADFAWTIPTVDISAYVQPRREADRDAVARALDAGAREVGFVQVVGHGIPPATIGGLTDAIDGFFAQPLAAKTALVGPAHLNRGYIPPRSESAARSVGIESASRMNDFFEAFKVGVEASAFPALDLPHDAYPENPWPASPDGFARAVGAYLTEADRVARTIVRIFADALGTPRADLEALTDHSLGTLQMINYALPEGEVTLDGELVGMSEHTDFGLVTVLWADAVPGLQVLGSDDLWHDVSPAPGALLVNFGDLISRFTNERWMSTLHRVKPPIVDGRIRRRRSAAFFFDGNVEAVISPLASCVADGEELIYAPITVGEHIERKVASLAGSANTSAVREGERVRQAAAR